MLTNANGKLPPQRAFTAPSKSTIVAVAVVFSSPVRAITVAPSEQMTIDSRSRWRFSSTTLSAPRQSRVPDGPHGPARLLDVVSMVVK